MNLLADESFRELLNNVLVWVTTGPGRRCAPDRVYGSAVASKEWLKADDERRVMKKGEGKWRLTYWQPS